MKSNFKPPLALFAILGFASAHGATFTIDTSLNELQPGVLNQGWWSDKFANNSPVNDNYFTGFQSGGEYRSFFSFDLSGISGTVTSATLNLQRWDQTGPLTLGLFDVSTPASTLVTGRQQGILSPTIFADLGSGNSYGTFPVNYGGFMDILSFSLNANALADINAMTGSGYFSIGGAVLSGSGYIFAIDGGGLPRELVLTTVPEPSTFALAGIGATVLLGLRRRR
jgi:hypothetical protein